MSMSINAAGGYTSWWNQPASQNTGSSQSASSSTSSSANAADLSAVFQQFSTALQSMLGQPTSGTNALPTASPADTAAATPPNGTSPTSPQQAGGAHHHHHHHGAGGESTQNAANQFVSQVAQLIDGGNVATTAASTTGSTLAADVMRALQNYGAPSSQPSGSTVSTTA
jgi:hypothetical protein